MEQVEELFEKYDKEKGSPVAAVIIEPIQSEGGTSLKGTEYYYTNHFYDDF